MSTLQRIMEGSDKEVPLDVRPECASKFTQAAEAIDEYEVSSILSSCTFQ
jgi:hypothetical protein